MFECSVIHWQHIKHNPPLLLKSIPTAIIVKICTKEVQLPYFYTTVRLSVSDK